MSALTAAPPPVYCRDWACPAWVSCRHHFGRSREYTAFDLDADVEFRDFDRAPGRDACESYELDAARPWLTAPGKRSAP